MGIQETIQIIFIECCTIIVLGAVGYRQAILGSYKGRCIIVACVC